MDLLPADAAWVDGGSRGVAGVEDDRLVRGIHSVPAQRPGARGRGHAGGAHGGRGAAATLGSRAGTPE